jgi:hypothetical protein
MKMENTMRIFRVVLSITLLLALAAEICALFSANINGSLNELKSVISFAVIYTILNH